MIEGDWSNDKTFGFDPKEKGLIPLSPAIFKKGGVI